MIHIAVATLGVSEIEKHTVYGICRFILNLCKERAFGTVEITLQDGQILLVRKTESYKPAVFLDDGH